MSSENGINPPAPNPSTNSNFTLLSVLGRERLTGQNYMDWMRNLRFTQRYENKEYVLDEQIPTINDDSIQEEIEAHQKHYDANKAKASKERLDVVKSLMACKPKPEASICAFVLEMKGYFDRLENLTMVFDTELSINIILSSLPTDYNQFVLSYQMNGKETSIMKLHSLLQTAEQGIKKSDMPFTSAAPVLTVGHNVEFEIAPTSDPKEAMCFYCNTKGHWKRSCPKYLKDLKGRKVEKGVHSVSQLTPPRTPQLNGVAEKRNKTLLDMKSHFGYLFYKPKDNVVFVARRGVFLERDMISKEDSGSNIDLEEIQEPADEEPIINSDTQQEVVTPVEPNEIYLPIHRTSSIMDVKTAFYNEKLTDDVFMAQPEGFENEKYPKRVCNLQKVIYGLKQASRSYNLFFHEKVTQFGFSRSEDESCVYFKVSRSVVVFQGAMTWKSSKQDTVADSTCEFEYITACVASMEAIWMKNFIGDLRVVPIVQDPIEILCDNESAVTLTKEPKDHKKSKHIERKYHFV
nr:hypothetical protein [Tanacetum cinerariifolium]